MERHSKKGVATAKFQDGGLSYSGTASDRNHHSDSATLAVKAKEDTDLGKEIRDLANLLIKEKDIDLAKFVAYRQDLLRRGRLSTNNRELLERVKPKLEQYLAEINELLRRSDDEWDF